MKKRNIYILYGIALLQGMVFYAPVATLYRQAAGLGIFQITLMESISYAMTIAMEIPWGYVADRIGYQKTMVLCCGLYALSKLIFWQATSFFGFLLERILLSVVCAGLSGVDSSLLYLSCEPEEAHRVFSRYQNLGQIGLLLAAGGFALFIGENYRLAALWTLASYALAALLSLGLQDVERLPEPGQSVGFRAALQSVWQHPKVLGLVLAAALLSQTDQMVTVFLNQLKYIQVGMSTEGISAAYIVLSLVGILGGLSAALGQVLGKDRMGTLLLLTGGAACCWMALTDRAWSSVGAVLLFSCCANLFRPLVMDQENEAVQAHDRATVLSVYSALEDGICVGLSLIYGALAEKSLTLALFVGSGMCLLAVMLYRVSRGKK